MSTLKYNIRAAVERELSARGYDDYPADRELWEEALDDVVDAVMTVVGEESA